MAFWAPQEWLLITAKSTHEIVILDAVKGKLLHRFGNKGAGVGELMRPNGIAVCDHLLFVVERDNHRVQVFSLPDCESLGVFGHDKLKRPYGIDLYKDNEDYWVYITDNPAPDSPTESVLRERVKLFQVHRTDSGMEAGLVQSFGSKLEKGALSKVESIGVDPEYNRVLIAEERQLRIKVYDLEGNFVGLLSEDSLFHYEPEGLALYKKSDSEGTWVMVDQKENKSRFLLFDRQTLAYLGVFQGQQTANTDGIALTELSRPGFSEGAFFAVHNDCGVAAFCWTEIAALLQ